MKWLSTFSGELSMQPIISLLLVMLTMTTKCDKWLTWLRLYLVTMGLFMQDELLKPKRLQSTRKQLLGIPFNSAPEGFGIYENREHKTKV